MVLKPCTVHKLWWWPSSVLRQPWKKKKKQRICFPLKGEWRGGGGSLKDQQLFSSNDLLFPTRFLWRKKKRVSFVNILQCSIIYLLLSLAAWPSGPLNLFKHSSPKGVIRILLVEFFWLWRPRSLRILTSYTLPTKLVFDRKVLRSKLKRT